MTAHTPNDTAPPVQAIWFELAAVEIEIGSAGHVAKLPGNGPGVLDEWQIAGTHLSSKNTTTGTISRPTKTLVVGFARPIVAGEAPVPKPKPVIAPRTATPAGAPPPRGPAMGMASSRRLQGAIAGVRPVPVAPGDVATAVESTVAGIVEAVAGSVGQILSGLGLPTSPAPVTIPDGAGCTCEVPQPAVEQSTASAVPCVGCGGWIVNANAQTEPA